MTSSAQLEAARMRVRTVLSSVQEVRGWAGALGAALESGAAADAYLGAVERLRRLLGLLEASVLPLEASLCALEQQARAAELSASGSAGG